MNGLSGRERRLLIILGGVLVVLLGVFLLTRGGSAEIPEIAFPTPSPTVAPTAPSVSPVFVVPPGARDPFGG